MSRIHHRARPHLRSRAAAYPTGVARLTAALLFALATPTAIAQTDTADD